MIMAEVAAFDNLEKLTEMAKDLTTFVETVAKKSGFGDDTTRGLG
jgi:hypothetical protein